MAYARHLFALAAYEGVLRQEGLQAHAEPIHLRLTTRPKPHLVLSKTLLHLSKARAQL